MKLRETLAHEKYNLCVKILTEVLTKLAWFRFFSSDMFSKFHKKL